jgi:hypothetical protein
MSSSRYLLGAIHTTLERNLDVQSLVGSAHYSALISLDTELPYIFVTCLGSTRKYTTSTTWCETYRLQVDCYGHDELEALAISDAVHGALDFGPAVITTGWVQNLTCTGEGLLATDMDRVYKGKKASRYTLYYSAFVSRRLDTLGGVGNLVLNDQQINQEEEV